MNYIIILNWNSAEETITCLNSLIKLDNFENNKIVICDNASNSTSYEKIKNFLHENHYNKYAEALEECVDELDGDSYFYLIRNKSNYGYAGGNNIGIKFALKQKNMEHVWVLNNDTFVEPDALSELIVKIKSNEEIGVCGSRLVDYYNRETVQSIGAKINTWFCTTSAIGNHYLKNDIIDERVVESNLDFVVGASMFFTRKFLEKVGLLCEEYFLYYEEIDICNRAKKKGFKVAVSSKSIVYHMEGGSTVGSISEIADYYMVRNRILISKKYYNDKIFFVKLSLIFIILNRFRRGHIKRGFEYFKFFKI